jgi:predicted dehydrogenase
VISSKLKVGIVGFGSVGKIRYNILKNNKFVNIVSISDKNITEQGDFSTEVKLYVDYVSMLNDESLDAVFIALPNYLAEEASIIALENGIHVFCEKPPARNPKEFKLVIAIAKKKPNLKLMYGFNHRFHPSVKRAKEIIESGDLGEVLNLRGEYGKSAIIKFSKDEWRAHRKYSGGGILLDQGIHLLDLMRYFSEDFVTVNSIVMNSFWNYDVEDNAYALMQTSNGIVAILHSSATLWRHSFRLEIGLTQGSILLSGILSSTKSYGDETIKITKSNHEKIGEPEEITYSFPVDTSWEEETNLFISKIINDEKVETGNYSEALSTLELVYKIYQSDTKWNKKFDIQAEI